MSALRRGLLVTAFTVATTTLGHATAHAAYTGSIFDYRHSSTVRVKVDRVGGRPVTATFSAAGLGLVCDDGSIERVSIPPMVLRFRGPTHFSGEFYARSEDGSQVYYLVNGRLRDRAGTMTGGITYFDDAFNPPAAPDGVDCDTAGDSLAWSASGGGRVGPPTSLRPQPTWAEPGVWRGRVDGRPDSRVTLQVDRTGDAFFNARMTVPCDDGSRFSRPLIWIAEAALFTRRSFEGQWGATPMSGETFFYRFAGHIGSARRIKRLALLHGESV
jgi:hypothetical protein